MSRKKESLPAVSGGQTLCAVLIFKIFTLMTFVPLIEQGYTFTVQTAAAAVSAVIQMIMMIPAVMLYGRSDAEFPSSGTPAGKAAFAVYNIYFCIASAGAVIRFSRFIDCRFGEHLSPAAIALMLSAVCMYCACCGIEGIVRGAAIMLVFFAAMALSVIIGSFGEISLENIRSGFSYERLRSGISEEIARSSELTALCYLMRFTSKDYGKSVFGAVAGKFAAAEAVTAAVMLALGDYAYISSYPFLDLGSAAGVRFLQRIDAVYMMIWTVTAVISVSVQIYLAGDCLSGIYGCGQRTGSIISSAAAAALSFILIILNINGDAFFRKAASFEVQIFTVSLIPLASYISSKLRERRKEPGYT